MTIGAYGVNYPANVTSTERRQRHERPRSVDGSKLPEHQRVLGGYSLGAAVADVVIA